MGNIDVVVENDDDEEPSNGDEHETGFGLAETTSMVQLDDEQLKRRLSHATAVDSVRLEDIDMLFPKRKWYWMWNFCTKDVGFMRDGQECEPLEVRTSARGSAVVAFNRSAP